MCRPRLVLLNLRSAIREAVILVGRLDSVHPGAR
jgi:hypothetical protein